MRTALSPYALLERAVVGWKGALIPDVDLDWVEVQGVPLYPDGKSGASGASGSGQETVSSSLSEETSIASITTTTSTPSSTTTEETMTEAASETTSAYLPDATIESALGGNIKTGDEPYIRPTFVAG